MKKLTNEEIRHKSVMYIKQALPEVVETLKGKETLNKEEIDEIADKIIACNTTFSYLENEINNLTYQLNNLQTEALK